MDIFTQILKPYKKMWGVEDILFTGSEIETSKLIIFLAETTLFQFISQRTRRILTSI